MKRLLLLLAVLGTAIGLYARQVRSVVLTTTPQMNCAKCEKKIRDYMRFERGIRSIKPVAKTQRIHIEYDADKTSVERIQAGLKRLGYEASVVTDSLPPASADSPPR